MRVPHGRAAPGSPTPRSPGTSYAEPPRGKLEKYGVLIDASAPSWRHRCQSARNGDAQKKSPAAENTPK